jgi:hypothetical protein
MGVDLLGSMRAYWGLESYYALSGLGIRGSSTQGSGASLLHPVLVFCALSGLNSLENTQGLMYSLVRHPLASFQISRCFKNTILSHSGRRVGSCVCGIIRHRRWRLWKRILFLRMQSFAVRSKDRSCVRGSFGIRALASWKTALVWKSTIPAI